MIKLISITPNSEKVIESMGRICYNSKNNISTDSSEIFIKSIIKRNHLSVLEHASASFEISNVSRSFTHQLVRHRLASYCQLSQRYVDQGEFKFIIPPSILDNLEAEILYSETMYTINETYKKLRNLGIKKEDARFILPEATETVIGITANFREWRSIFELRLTPHAQWEIRTTLLEILKELTKLSPNCFGDLLEKYNKEI